MKIDPSIYEEDFLDDEDVPFQKLTRKTKIAKQDKQTVIQRKRKEKMRRQEASEQEDVLILINDENDQERD